MAVSSAFRVFVLISFIALCQSKTEETSKNIISEAASKALDPASAPTEDNNDAVRKKKSATTTLCVEIRPSGPYQRPFQICEPAEAKQYSQPSYYPTTTYEEVKPAATPKPAAAYESPVKSYVAPKPTAAPAYASSKPYAAHSPSSYSSVSYRSEDGMGEFMEEEEDEHSGEEVEHMMRSVGQESYGLPITFMAPPIKHKQKKGHNGLVITCQPSLAGYAATLPSYGGAYGGPSYGGYRSTARSYNRYERPAPKAPQQYANYGPAPGYKVSAPVYKQNGYSSYKAPSYSISSYNAPVYRPAPSYNAPSYGPPPPAYKPLPPPPPPPPAYKPVYAPAPAPVYSQPPSAYSSHPAPAPIPYGYSSGPSYAPPPPPPPPQPIYAPAPKPHPQPVYSAPGTYRASEDHQVEVTTQISKEDKEQHTLHRMEETAAARTVAMKTGHEDAPLKISAPGWQPVEKDEHRVGTELTDLEENQNWNNRESEKDEGLNELRE